MDKKVRKSPRTWHYGKQEYVNYENSTLYISGVWANRFKHDILETRLVYRVNFAGGMSDNEIISISFKDCRFFRNVLSLFTQSEIR